MFSPSITIDHVLPWGRSFDEYVRMFNLEEVELAGRILSCADGPAAFNAEMNRRGRRVVSADPIYVFAADEIRSRISAAKDLIVANTSAHMESYRWDEIESLDELVRVRMEAMAVFLGDFAAGCADGRYCVDSLPQLAFRDKQFDLCLCSHFLFTYSTQLDRAFHAQAIAEMRRVAHEVRVFPLLDMDGAPSSHVEWVRNALDEMGFDTRVARVPYEYQKGGHSMLVVS